MSVQKVKIYHDGSHFVAKLGCSFAHHAAQGSREVNPEYEQFKIFYGEAVEKKITKKGIVEYIQDRFIDVCDDILDIPDEVVIASYYKRYVTTLHKRLSRTRKKAYLNDWNWFVTFTYDDKKMTQEEFEKQIRTKLSDLSSHQSWYYMMRWEDGELNERRHLHAFIFVPEGKMVGELYLDKHYSYKRRKTEFFTNNTYFNERFGVSEWKDLSGMKNTKALVNYLTKYMAKNDGKIIYSRGIPDELEAEIDIEDDILVTYESHHRVLGVVNRFLFGTKNERRNVLRSAFRVEDLVAAKAVPI